MDNGWRAACSGRPVSSDDRSIAWEQRGRTPVIRQLSQSFVKIFLLCHLMAQLGCLIPDQSHCRAAHLYLSHVVSNDMDNAEYTASQKTWLLKLMTCFIPLNYITYSKRQTVSIYLNFNENLPRNARLIGVYKVLSRIDNLNVLNFLHFNIKDRPAQTKGFNG